jgi:hypothetical protein
LDRAEAKDYRDIAESISAGVQNWQIDTMQTYMYNPAFTGVGYMTWLAWDNPNYNVHLIAASLVMKW